MEKKVKIDTKNVNVTQNKLTYELVTYRIVLLW